MAKTSFHALFFAERPTLPIVILPARLSMQYPAETRAAERSHRREESIGSGEAKIRSTWRAKVLKQMSVFDSPRVSLRKKMFSESSRDETNYPLYLRILIFAPFLCWSDGLLRAQNFVPPASAQKYSFYPQGGNFFGV